MRCSVSSAILGGRRRGVCCAQMPPSSRFRARACTACEARARSVQSTRAAHLCKRDDVEVAQHARADEVAPAARRAHRRDQLRVHELPAGARAVGGHGPGAAHEQSRTHSAAAQQGQEKACQPAASGAPEGARRPALVPPAVLKPLAQQLQRRLRKVALALRARRRAAGARARGGAREACRHTVPGTPSARASWPAAPRAPIVRSRPTCGMLRSSTKKTARLPAGGPNTPLRRLSIFESARSRGGGGRVGPPRARPAAAMLRPHRSAPAAARARTDDALHHVGGRARGEGHRVRHKLLGEARQLLGDRQRLAGAWGWPCSFAYVQRGVRGRPWASRTARRARKALRMARGGAARHAPVSPTTSTWWPPASSMPSRCE